VPASVGALRAYTSRQGSPAGLLIKTRRKVFGTRFWIRSRDSCKVPTVCEFDRTREWRLLPDLHGEGSFVADVPVVVE
jgi:hypothetical protein